jgi:hypothetical protein
MRARRSLPIWAAVITVGFLTSGIARATTAYADEAEAERLFEEGRALVDAGKISEGCAALAESQKIDPSPGTLLNLALCHEAEGDRETARTELRESLAIAIRDGREDRAAIAQAHLTILGPPAKRATPIGLDLVLTAAVFFASGVRGRRERPRAD